VDTNKLIENSKLLELLERLKLNYDNQLEHEFFMELISTHLLTPITKDSLIGYVKANTTLKEGTTIKIIHLSDDAGNKYIPAFTDWNELRKWCSKKDIKTLILSFDDYKTIVSSADSSLNGFVLNPFGQNIMFNKDLIQKVEDNTVTIVKGESVMLGIPEKYPVKMIDALKQFLPSISLVNSAYLLWMVRGENDRSLLLIVDADGDYNKVFGKIADIAVNYLEENEKLDFVPLAEEFGKNAVEGHSPFYLKN
jgi:hypothetical protein